MSLKSAIALIYAKSAAARLRKKRTTAVADQQACFNNLIEKARNTEFGKAHDFENISSYIEFCERVPIRDYEGLTEWIKQIREGQPDILWPGKPLYLSKTSGTTSGIKYIPITRDSIPNHINTARNALLMYIAEKNSAAIVNGKMIFLSGSPQLTQENNIPIGRLSGIVNHHVPSYLKGNQLPSYESNCIDDWEEKLDAIVGETINENMTLISGIPPWVQMYFDRLQQKSGKLIGDLFPEFSLFVYGGVNFQPYRSKLESGIGRAIDSLELYPASEGFIAFQDTLDNENGMLLNTDSGIFFEFVKAEDFFSDNRKRILLQEVETGVNYAIILSNNAGLWAYNIGDTVSFVSKDPYRLIVSGRLKHFISAFGEHVIAKEVDKAMNVACEKTGVKVVEFTLAPQVNPLQGQPFHEWFVEFESQPEDNGMFANELDTSLRKQNIYYDDLRRGNILKNLVVTSMQKNAFINYMKSKGKLGGQNKLPRLSNDRIIADELSTFTLNQHQN